MSKYTCFDVSIKDYVAHVVMNRPEEFNSMTRLFWKELPEIVKELDKIAAALPQVKGLGDIGDTELDEVSSKSIAAYDDLMDLGMNVESRYSGRIFEVAGQMLKINLDSKVAKLDKKLKMVELQLKKEKLDKDNAHNLSNDIVEAEGYVVSDRNSLLAKLKGLPN